MSDTSAVFHSQLLFRFFFQMNHCYLISLAIFLVIHSVIANRGHYWWEENYVVEDDAFHLRNGDNIIVASVGNNAFLNYSISEVIRSYSIDLCSVLDVNIDGQVNSDSVVGQLKIKSNANHRNRRTLLVLRGAERLKNDELSNLDVLFSIPDRTYGLSNVIAILAWNIDDDKEYVDNPFPFCEDSDADSEMIQEITECIETSTSKWSNYLIHRLQSRENRNVNGAAIVGRIRHFGVQNISAPLPTIALSQPLPVCSSNNLSSKLSVVLFLVIATGYLMFLKFRYRDRATSSSDVPIIASHENMGPVSSSSTSLCADSIGKEPNEEAKTEAPILQDNASKKQHEKPRKKERISSLPRSVSEPSAASSTYNLRSGGGTVTKGGSAHK